MNEIVKNLYLGNVFEACKYGDDFDLIISVMPVEELTSYEKDLYFSNKNPMILFAPTYRTHKSYSEKLQCNIIDEIWVDPTTMNFVAQTIQTAMDSGHKILVHCAAAQERSPLAIIWWLHIYQNMPIDDAYQLVRNKKPTILDRRSWLKKLVPGSGYCDD